MREFRSELPCIIYKRGIEVVPVTLEVGDYVLTPDICVERKSPADLAGSLQNGRLYAQAQQMLRHYKKAILLIETPTGSRCETVSKKKLKRGPFGGEMGPASRDVRAKLTVLTRQCPRLRLAWSASPQATVDLFEELKWKKPEPDPEMAQSLKSDETGTAGLENCRAKGGKMYSIVGKKMVLKLPGVSEKNANKVMEEYSSFLDLCQKITSSEETKGKAGLSKFEKERICKFLKKDFL